MGGTGSGGGAIGTSFDESSGRPGGRDWRLVLLWEAADRRWMEFVVYIASREWKRGRGKVDGAGLLCVYFGANRAPPSFLSAATKEMKAPTRTKAKAKQKTADRTKPAGRKPHLDFPFAFFARRLTLYHHHPTQPHLPRSRAHHGGATLPSTGMAAPAAAPGASKGGPSEGMINLCMAYEQRTLEALTKPFILPVTIVTGFLGVGVIVVVWCVHVCVSRCRLFCFRCSDLRWDLHTRYNKTGREDDAPQGAPRQEGP